MQSVICFTVLLALATAAVLPHPKSNGQNELIPNTEYTGKGNGDYEDAQAREEHATISNSFDAVVNVMRQYKNDLANTNDFGNMENVISIPDTVNVGNSSDTYFTDVHVTGLKNFRSQNVIMSWEKDAVNVQNSWEKLTVNGKYHFVNPSGRHSGSFEIVLIEPVYAGNTSLTKNANVYATMSPANSVVFRKAVVNHTALPTVFQNEKPQFDYFVKNVVCQHVATAMADGMYNDMVMNIRHSVRPYLTYGTDKIADGDAAAPWSAARKLADGGRFRLDNVRLDRSKNNLAKIYYVQMNNTEQTNTAELRLRLLNLTGECDYAVTAADGKSHAGRLAFAFKTVRVVPTMDFADKTVRTRVWVGEPTVETKATAGSADAAAAWTNAEEQWTAKLVECFEQNLADATSQNIRDIM